MKKIIFKATALAIVFLIAGCNADEIVKKMDGVNQPTETKTFTVEAVIPGDDASLKSLQTRVGLDKETSAVKLTWKVGDVIELCFVQEGKTPEKSEPIILTSADILENGKKARFGFDLPEEFDTGDDATFTLYGVHGGGLDDTDPFVALLSENNSRLSLQEVEDNNDVMLYFSQEGISITNPSVSVNFEHLGSIYNITVENKSEATLDLSGGMKLVPVEGSTGWVYISGGFNLASKEITGTAADEITFDVPAGTEVPTGGSITISRWIPVLSDNANWPELALEFNGNRSWDSKGARVAVAGKNYILNAQWDGIQLSFEQYTPEYSKVFMVGDATPGGWEIDDAFELTWIEGPDEFVYEGLLDTGEMKFVLEERDWESVMVMPMENGETDLDITEFQIVPPSPDGRIDYKWVITEAAYYKITLNLKDKTIHFEWLRPQFERVFMVGDATPGGWEIDDAFELTWIEGPDVFVYEGMLKAGEMKFPLEERDWGSSFLMPMIEGQEDLTITEMQVVPSGGVDYKWLISEETAGNYKITINVGNLTIQFEKQ